MAITACPHCHKSIELKAVGVNATPDNALGRVELRAVRNFLADQTPGRRMFTAEVFENYELFRREIEKGSPELTKNALARALRAFGAVPWRNATGRGWIMPEVSRGSLIPKPARSVLEAEDEAAYREMVAKGGPDQPAVNRSPFGVDPQYSAERMPPMRHELPPNDQPFVSPF